MADPALRRNFVDKRAPLADELSAAEYNRNAERTDEAWDYTQAGTPTGEAVRTGDAAAGRAALDAQGVLPVGYYTPTGKPDGAVGPMDSGQVVASFGNSIGSVSGGEIVHTPAVATNSAAYYQIDAGARVRRFGCEVKWPAGAIGALAMVLPVSAWGPPGGYPVDSAAQVSAGVHLVMYGHGVWHCSRFNQPGATETKYAEYTTHGRYADVRDGQFHTVEMWIDTDTGEATLFFPDGGIAQFSHTAIRDDTSNWVVWEQYENNQADVPCIIRNLWCDSQPRRQDTHTATRADIAELIRSSGAGKWGHTTTVTSATQMVLTADSTEIQQFTGSAAQTVQLPSTGLPAGGLFLISNTSSNTVTVNAANGAFITALAAGNNGFFFATVSGPTLPSHWVPIIYATVNTNQSITDKTLVNAKITQSINAQTGTAYTLVLADSDKLITLNNTAATTMTVPANSTAAIPVGRSIDLAQLGAGQVTIAPAAGVTLSSRTGLRIAGQNGTAKLTKIATDTWIVSGDLVA